MAGLTRKQTRLIVVVVLLLLGLYVLATLVRWAIVLAVAALVIGAIVWWLRSSLGSPRGPRKPPEF